MNKNPLKSVNISDNNSLKKQRDYGKIIKKYEKVKLKTEPNELQKYYQYLTYQQPILDELNYVAERMRTEDIKTKTDDYNFIEDLKIKREKLMKETATAKKEIGTETLFDAESIIKQEDMTPVIDTTLEMVYPAEPQPREIQEYKNDLFGDANFDDLLSIADTAPIREEKFELSDKPRRIRQPKTPEQIAEIEAKKAAKKASAAEKKAAAAAEKAATTIQKAIRVKKAIDETSDIAAAKEIERIKAAITEEVVKKEIKEVSKAAKKGKKNSKGGKKK
jgi:hypothetical protein